MGEQKIKMRKQKSFSLIELLIVVAEAKVSFCFLPKRKAVVISTGKVYGATVCG
jgi:competence protein ComGC